MSAPYHTDCWGLVTFIFHLFGFGIIGGVVGVARIIIIEAACILLRRGQLLSIFEGLLANSYIYQLVLENKTSWRYKVLKLLKSQTFRGLIPGLGSGIVNFKKQDRTRYQYCSLKKTRPDSVSVLFIFEKQAQTWYWYRSISKNKTRFGIGIIQLKKTRPESVLASVSFNFKKRDQTRSRYCSTSKCKTSLGISIIQL